MITTLALVLFTCNVEPNHQQDRCEYKIEHTYSGPQAIRTDIIDCMRRLDGYPDVMSDKKSFTYAGCYTATTLEKSPNVAYLSNLEAPEDSFLAGVDEVDDIEAATETKTFHPVKK